MARLAFPTWLPGPVAFAALLAGCYETPTPACIFLCGEGGACPDGYRCSEDDNRCHRVEPNGSLAACPDSLAPDAAAMIDADPDATEPDAMVDASEPDAMVDAPPIDAMVDAPPIDAMIDAPPPDAFVCPPSLNPADDGTGAARQALVISEINPGDYIELYNNTAAAIDLSLSNYQLCSPFVYAALPTLLSGETTVEPGGFIEIAWPANFTDVDGGGELQLYTDGQDFDDGTKIMDFVCWGTNPHGSRKAQAEAAGKWTAAAPCAPAITGGAIHRLAATDGKDAADYSTVMPPSPATCAPD